MDPFNVLAIVAILFCIAFPIALLAGRNWWVERRFRLEGERLLRESPELCSGTPQYNARFDRPDFAALEAHLGRPLPEPFKELFRQSNLVRKAGFVIKPPGSRSSDWLAFGEFWPVDQLAIEGGQWTSSLTDGPFMPFGHDDNGEEYQLAIDSMTEDDAQVYFHWHEVESNHLVAPSLKEMLSWPRLTMEQYYEASGV
jgi:hypothetical protein